MSFDPTKPVQTRDGRKARIICTDHNHIQPVIALVETGGVESIERHGLDGSFNYAHGEPSTHDLINIPEEKWSQWSSEELPLDAWFRETAFPDEWFKVASRWFANVGGNKVLYVEFTDSDRGTVDLAAIFSKCEHSTDLGKTWHKCGVKNQ